MSDTTIVNHEYRLKRGEASEIEKLNPELGRGEPLVYFADNGAINLKIGDGKRRADELPYVNESLKVSGDYNEDIISDAMSDKNKLIHTTLQQEIDINSNLISELSKSLIELKEQTSNQFANERDNSILHTSNASYNFVKDDYTESAHNNNVAFFTLFSLIGGNSPYYKSKKALSIDDDYYIDISNISVSKSTYLQLSNKNNFSIYGNGHTLRIKSRTAEDAISFLTLYGCNNVTISNLTIESIHDQEGSVIGDSGGVSSGSNILSIEGLTESEIETIKNSVIGGTDEEKANWELPKSSNITGLTVKLTSNLSIQNCTFKNIATAISMQGDVQHEHLYEEGKDCFNISIDGLNCENILMGVYASSCRNVRVSNFKVDMDPVNSFEKYHAFYLNYDMQNVTLLNGEINHKIVYQSFIYPFKGVSKLEPIYYTTPSLDVRGGGAYNPPRYSSGFIAQNVKINSQRMFSTENRNGDRMSLVNCEFISHSPYNPAVHGTGQLVIRDNTSFDNCKFEFDNLCTAITTVKGKSYSFNQCNIKGSVVEVYDNNGTLQSGLTNVLLPIEGDVTFINSSINWPQNIRYILAKRASDIGTTVLYDCKCNVTGDYRALGKRGFFWCRDKFTGEASCGIKMVSCDIGDNCFSMFSWSSNCKGFKMIDCKGTTPTDGSNSDYYWGIHYGTPVELSNDVVILDSTVNGFLVSPTNGYIPSF